jgi:hypothetical protein
VTRNRFVLLCTAVVLVAFAAGLAWGLSTGGSGGSTAGSARSATSAPTSTPTEGPGLPAAVYADCQSRDVAAGAGWTCTSPLPGIDQVLVTRWPSADAMAADFTTTYQPKPDGKCGSYSGDPASGYRSTWGNGKPLACYVNSNGAAVVMWEVPDKALQLLAIRKDGDTKAAFTWWTKAIATPL